MKSRLTSKLIILFIFLAGFFLRISHITWDNFTHLHPDERFLTMVSADISLPKTLASYFDTANSPLNPTNYESYRFFVYGTFPIFLTRFFAEKLNYTSYDQIYIIGRYFSAFFDSLVILSLYAISKLIFRNHHIFSYLPSLLYAFCVLPLQLSHFYAVDTFLSSFLFLCFAFLVFYFITHKSYFVLLSSLMFGLAMSSKISALYFSPIIFLLILLSSFDKNRILFVKLTRGLLLFAIPSLLVFRIFQPYAFIDLFTPNPIFIQNLQTLADQSRPDAYFPPSVQWLSKTKIIFPFQNIALWGIGLPFFGLIIFHLARYFRSPKHLNITGSPAQVTFLSALIWVLFLFFYQGTQFTFAMRYFLPIYPFILFLAAYILHSTKLSTLSFIFIFLHLVWGLAFVSIYSRPQTRIQASAWIYQHLPAGSNLTNEYWDDPLPLYLPDLDPYIYNSVMLPLYDPDTPQKWDQLNPIINQTDFIIMSSNRLWGSIPQVPQNYSQTSQYYQQLFSGQLGFSQVAKFVSYPGFEIPLLSKCFYLGPTNYPAGSNTWFETDSICAYPGVYFRDDTADESFTVYDHPQVLIFGRR